MDMKTIYSVIIIDTNYDDWSIVSFEDYNDAIKYLKKELKNRGENYTKKEIEGYMNGLGMISVGGIQYRLEEGNFIKKK